MVVLLDTHFLIWLWTDDPRLSRKVRDFLVHKEQPVHVSIATFWELSIKRSIGKLDLAIDLNELSGSMDEFGFGILNIDLAHTNVVSSLPLHHRDPFDRMLIAQAKHEGMHLLTIDPHFKLYDVDLLDL